MFWGASDEFLLLCANFQTILAFFFFCLQSSFINQSIFSLVPLSALDITPFTF